MAALLIASLLRIIFPLYFALEQFQINFLIGLRKHTFAGPQEIQFQVADVVGWSWEPKWEGLGIWSNFLA